MGKEDEVLVRGESAKVLRGQRARLELFRVMHRVIDVAALAEGKEVFGVVEVKKMPALGCWFLPERRSMERWLLLSIASREAMDQN